MKANTTNIREMTFADFLSRRDESFQDNNQSGNRTPNGNQKDNVAMKYLKKALESYQTHYSAKNILKQVQTALYIHGSKAVVTIPVTLYNGTQDNAVVTDARIRQHEQTSRIDCQPEEVLRVVALATAEENVQGRQSYEVKRQLAQGVQPLRR